MKAIYTVLMAAGLLLAETVTLEPVADTYTIPAGGCFGSADELLMANKSAVGHPDERSMLVWDLSEYSGRTVLEANVNLNVFFQCGSGTGTDTEVFAITESWDETWSGAHPETEDSPSAEYFFLGTGWHGIEVTGLVERWLSGEISNFGLAFKVNGTYPYTKCYSRETQYSPTLELVLEDAALVPCTWASIKGSIQE